MDNFYSMLGVPSDATQEKIDEAYYSKLKNPNPGIGDYENIHELINIKRVYPILSNKTYRFLYDVKHGFYSQNRYPIIFKGNQESIQFLTSINEKIHSLKQQITNLTTQNLVINKLIVENNEIAKKLTAEKNQSNEAKKTICDLLEKIDILSSESKTKIIEQESQNNKLNILESQNERLRLQVRRNRIETFKIVCFISAILMMITYFLAINL
ncbi:J domain-containing protein [Bacteroidales bacterium OttesenSCG-928-A17]|nr:J domain-containing protein [Bacteroidales bacterium OttesenSCG-928-A17]